MPEFDARRQWLDEYLARPHLWPGQVDAIRVLADQLGVEIQFYRLDLNAPAAGWRPYKPPEKGHDYEEQRD